MGACCAKDKAAQAQYQPILNGPRTPAPRYKAPDYDPMSETSSGGGAGAALASETGGEEEEKYVATVGGAEATMDDGSMTEHKKRTLRPQKEHKKGTRRSYLHQKLRESFSSGTVNLEDFVRLPDGEDKDEWIAVHVIDFYNDLSLLYGTISDLCTAETCPVMSAGSKYTYLWADGVTITTPMKVPAREYVDYLMQWVDDQISNEDIFPVEVGQSFPHNFQDQMRVVFKRLFRVYAHMYRGHFKQFARLGVEQHLHMCFKRFVFFSLEFKMVDDSEFAPLRKLVDKITAG